MSSELKKGTIFRIFLPRYIPGADDIETPKLPEMTGAGHGRRDVGGRRDGAHRAPPISPGRAPSCWSRTRRGCACSTPAGSASRGYTVIEAGNGVEALEELEQHGGHVDLVVSDVVMPEMDGPTLLKELRKRNPTVRIIFVSGYAEDAFGKSLPENERPAFPRQAVHAQAADRRRQGDDGVAGFVCARGAIVTG